MRQLIMETRRGSVGIADLPEAALRPGMLLVRNAFSQPTLGQRGAMGIAAC